MATEAEIKAHVRTYIKVFAALATLTIVTVLASYLNVGVAAGIFIAMLIAVTKGSLVASFFMHLFYDRRAALYGLLILCFIFFAFLMLLPVLTVEEAVTWEDVS